MASTKQNQQERKVLISHGFGAGWMTWNRDYAEDFLFDAELIAVVEAGEDLGDTDDPNSPLGQFVQRLIDKHGEDARHVYLGGAYDLHVETASGPFRVEEYDGSESMTLASDESYF